MSIKELYEKYQSAKNILVNHDEILAFFPDYFKIKSDYTNLTFVSKDYICEYFEENWKNSSMYTYLSYLAMADNEIYNIMRSNMEFKYTELKHMFTESIKAVIKLCDLIDYIGHYPTTWPVPKEEEKNPEMEELLQKYDIMVRYYNYDVFDKMQITSDDVIRLIETINKNIDYVNTVLNVISNDNWIFRKKSSHESIRQLTDQVVEDIKAFPQSAYQEKGKSHREEEKMYLRRQFGENII